MKKREAPLLLIVDDSVDTRDIYAQYLRYLGYRVEEASDGRDALTKAAALSPDLAVVDLSLPHVSGREVTKRLKSDPQTKGIRILILSGHILPTTQQALTEAGADGYLTKPCVPEDLAARIAEMLGKGFTLRPSPRPAASPGSKPGSRASRAPNRAR